MRTKRVPAYQSIHTTLSKENIEYIAKLSEQTFIPMNQLINKAINLLKEKMPLKD